MSNNKQSSIEWLIDQLGKNGTFMINELGEKTKVFTLPNEYIINEFKAMHKEEHKRTYIIGFSNVLQPFEQYYKETFENNKSVKIGQGGFGVTNGGNDEQQ